MNCVKGRPLLPLSSGHSLPEAQHHRSFSSKMVELPSLSARWPVPSEAITSSINRALTPQALVCALADEEVTHLVRFDYCTLVLPEPGGGGIRFWHAARHD